MKKYNNNLNCFIPKQLFNTSSGLLHFSNTVFTLHSRCMFLMHSVVIEEICCVMICSFCLCIHFLVLLWPDNAPNFGPKLVRKHVHKSVLVMIGDILDLCG